MNRRQEQKALMMLLGVLVLLVIGILVYLLVSHRQEDALESGTSGRQESVRDARGSTVSSDRNVVNDGAVQSPISITFDPNTADSATLVAVGLSPFQARNVLRYRQKGGQYHRPEDFKRLYGLTVAQWEHLEPLIKIGRQFQYLADVEDVNTTYPKGRRSFPSRKNEEGFVEADDSTLHSTHPFRSNTPRNKIQKGEFIDLSRCDTSELKRVPGIGSYYARRIFEYSEKLGGFVSLEQLNDDELSFLPTDIEQYLAVGSGVSVRKLRINQLTVRELVRHPYITYAQAKQIVNRVRVNGPFRSWDELLFLPEFTNADRKRLEPYVEF